MAELRAIGFFQNQDDTQLQDEYHRAWGCEASNNRLEVELMLSSLDRSKVWCSPVEIEGSLLGYLDFFTALGALGPFRPSEVSLQQETVSFSADCYTYRFEVSPGSKLDLGVLEVVNSSLWGRSQYEVCDGLGMPDLVLFLTPQQKAALQTRPAWTFQESLSNTGSKRTHHGWLNDYSEQGMESQSWRVFQDRQYCSQLETGWEREGMIFLQEHDVLTLYEPSGEIHWSGELLSRRHWLTRLYPSSMDYRWFPPDLSASSWAKFFTAKPPLRASLERLSTAPLL